MNITTTRRRYPARAAAITTIAAVIFGAAACGTETASDGGHRPRRPWPRGHRARRTRPCHRTRPSARHSVTGTTRRRRTAGRSTSP